MCRPMLSMWWSVNNRIQECKFALDRRSYRLFTFIILIASLLETQCKNLSSTEIIVDKFVNEKSPNILTNEILSNKDDDFHLGYSGYLHSSTSMLTFRAKLNSDGNILPINKNDTFKRVKMSKHRRLKRGVTHLYNMIVCATGCNPLAYKGYGCYCGFLGSGYPMDGIDRCCKMHDWCYDATECPMFVEYFVPYYWKCYHGYKPICAIEHGEWGSSGSCAQRLCECDRSFAECLRRYRCPKHKAVCTSSPWRLIQNLFMII